MCKEYREDIHTMTMKTEKEQILQDALKTAIEYNKKIILLKRIIFMLVVIIGILAYGCMR